MAEELRLVKMRDNDTVHGEIIYKNGEPYQLIPIGTANNLAANRGYKNLVKGAAIALAVILFVTSLPRQQTTVVNNIRIPEPKVCGLLSLLFGC